MKLFQQLFTLDFCSCHFSQLKAIVCLKLVGKTCGGKEDDNTQNERQDIWESSKLAPIYLPQCSLMGYKNKDILMCTITSYYCQQSQSRYWDHSFAKYKTSLFTSPVTKHRWALCPGYSQRSLVFSSFQFKRFGCYYNETFELSLFFQAWF